MLGESHLHGSSWALLLSMTDGGGDVVGLGFGTRVVERALLPATLITQRETNRHACSRLHAALPLHYRPCHLARLQALTLPAIPLSIGREELTLFFVLARHRPYRPILHDAF
jgi:hypothetical protein